MRKVTKIIVYYDDGSYQEINAQPTYPQVPDPWVNPQPYKNDEFPKPFDPNKIPKWEPVTQCSKCGLKLDKIMGYVCTNYPCPCGLGGAWCGTGKLE